MNIIIHRIPAFQDNYLWLCHKDDSTNAVVVDPGDAAPVLATLQAQGLLLTDILVTHQHADHIGGVGVLLDHFPRCRVFGPSDIAVVNQPVSDGARIQAAEIAFSVLSVPGHTLNHLAYFTNPQQAAPILFCGDTLFAGGCGRLFEGTPEQMYHSLNKISQLPENTRIYCAHEYTLANLRFAQAVEPSNEALIDRLNTVQELRCANQPTVPSVLNIEKQTNPFLRASQPAVQAAASEYAGHALNNEIDVFATVRRWKDSY